MGKLKYIARRLLQMIPILFGVSLILFILIALVPGDFIDANASPEMTAAKIAQLKALYGYDRPMLIRYFIWLGNALRGDLGLSFTYMRPVTSVINSFVWNSFLLAVFAFVIQVIIAVPIGVVSATRQYSRFDMIFTVFALIGLAMPAFFIGLMLIKFMALDHKWLPLSGMVTPGVELAGLTHVLDVGKHMIMPLIVLALLGIGSLMRYSRTAMLEVIRQDYIRTARAKGVRERVVIYRHALRNALIPIVTIIGMSLPGLFSGAIITERVFAWPGIGKVALEAVSKRDYPLIMGFNMFLAVLTLLSSLFADLAYSLVDPRIQLK